MLLLVQQAQQQESWQPEADDKYAGNRVSRADRRSNRKQHRISCSGSTQSGKNAVENNYLSVSEKTELEIAKQTIKNSKDPAEREKAQQKYDALLEKDIQ